MKSTGALAVWRLEDTSGALLGVSEQPTCTFGGFVSVKIHDHVLICEATAAYFRLLTILSDNQDVVSVTTY